jgi:uncharacterized protein with ATP-grasp and redox domains
MSTLLPLPLPGPYVCDEPGSFAENTLLVRLPEIARRVLAENRLPPEAILKVEDLLAEMRDGHLRPLNDPGAPDAKAWDVYLKPYLGKPWRELSFLVCENIFYRRILEATGYFQYGFERHMDPYGAQKRLGLETSVEPLKMLAMRLETWREMDTHQAFWEAVESNLWGNRADMSIWPAGAEGTISNDQLHQAEEFLLVNELPRLCDFICGLRGARIDFLIDNAGFELVSDMALADLFLGMGTAREVRLHLKFHPTFVSDALILDARQTAAYLADLPDQATSAFGKRLVDEISSGRLRLVEHAFWNSPLADWEMPSELREGLAEADLVISKGDMNFRRLVGDLHWEETTPFARITEYFPTRLAALRVTKSMVEVGLRPGQAEFLDQSEPGWRFNGRWGMIQFQ